MHTSAQQKASEIFRAAAAVIRIHGIGGRRWKRNVAKGGRIGPWLPARYDIVNRRVWEARVACLYMIAGRDQHIRYAGISRNRMKDRWRESPAYDAETMQLLPQKQLFHSQCWKHIERESAIDPSATFEVRCIDGAALLSILERLGPPLSAFTALHGDGEGIVAGVERWMCNNRSPTLVSWNVSMTA